MVDYNISYSIKKALIKKDMVGDENELFRTTQLEETRMKLGVKLLKEKNPDLELDILAVENRFFGGSILSAGLLVVDNFRYSLEEYRDRLEI